jgi:probable O-glycosylation ligase (exosortase A-associated)
MRDLILLFIVFGALLFVPARPYRGVLLWAWLGFMNPHRFGWGLAASLPLSAITVGVTVVAALFSREPKRIPWSGMLFVWVALVVWINIATLFALIPDNSWPEWSRTMKIQFAILLMLMLINTRERLTQMVWVTALSLGFFGVKGGLFALATGGNYLVMGPPQSFIADNNSLALALIMALPLIRFLHLQEKRPWLRRALLAAMGLTAVAILTTHSRGALLAGSAMALVLWFKSPGKLKTALAMLILLPAAIAFMPEKWFERMSTIRTYQQDTSAMGRINAWEFAVNVANDRPLTGAGFNAFKQELFDKYAPDPRDLHDAHSIYFEMLAEQGYVGLVLFLTLGWLAFRTGARIAALTRERPELGWARDLGAMIQVSLVGYAIGGAFLGLAYFDLYYHLVAILAITRSLVERSLATAPSLQGSGQQIGAPLANEARSA